MDAFKSSRGTSSEGQRCATAEAVRVEAPSAFARPRAHPSCPLCERPAWGVFLSREEVATELDRRDRFFARRLNRCLSCDELRDLTNVALGTRAAILRCMRCGVLIRDSAPGDELFRDDNYGDGVLRRLHEMHVGTFREKEIDYRSLLPPNARIIEVGSYAGGFLAVTAEWGWSATGTDIGCDPVRFCRSLGLDTHCLPLQHCGLDSGSYDAVFVWNCFEQIANPREVLAAARRLLRGGGLLVIRFPDAGAYIRWEQESAIELLAYNSLLGWPHRYGYDTATARSLVERYGFAFVRGLRRPAVRPFRDAMHRWAREEEAALIADAGQGWLELTFRRPGIALAEPEVLR